MSYFKLDCWKDHHVSMDNRLVIVDVYTNGNTSNIIDSNNYKFLIFFSS